MLRKILLIVLVVITVLWTAFIFSNSLDNAEQSTEKSSTVTEIVNNVASAVGVEEEIPHSTVRDMAHFTEFAILAILVCADLALAFTMLLPHRPLLYALCPVCALILSFVLACVDELLQKSSEGRAAQFSDVWLDTLGALTGTAFFCICYLSVLFIRRKRKKICSTVDTELI